MNDEKQDSFSRFRQRVFRMVSVGVVDDPINAAYDVISTLALLVNLTAAILSTFENIHAAHGPLLNKIEAVTVTFFAVRCACSRRSISTPTCRRERRLCAI